MIILVIFACNASCVLRFTCSSFENALSLKLFPPPRCNAPTGGDVPNPTIRDVGTLSPRMKVLSFSVFCPPFVYLSRKDTGKLLFLFGVLGLLFDKPAARSSPNACAMSFTASAFCYFTISNVVIIINNNSSNERERERKR